MSRTARLLLALLGLWGGALAWSHANQPAQEHVAHLRYTGGTTAHSGGGALPVIPATPREEDRIVRRDLFASTPRAPRTIATAAVAAIPPSATPPPAAAKLAPPAVHYVGFVVQGAIRKVLISGTAGVRAVAEGDSLGDGWRVDRIDDDRILLRSALTGDVTEIPRTP